MNLVFMTASRALADYWAGVFESRDAIHVDSLASLLERPIAAESLVLLDLATDAELAQQIETHQVCEQYRVLALSSSPSNSEGMIWLQLGAAGYAHALSTSDVLKQVAGTIQSGGIWVGRSIMQQMCARFGQLSSAPSQTRAWAERLSPRETEVVEALKRGLSNKEIARQLDISERTVKARLTSVFQKFGVEDRLQLLLKLTTV
ncbi:response regulator transcription factor [Pseudogulbenkiania sp. MAI-1]|uniref:response regulator transcription factor n=1 Tax=Pseudogulbenkiania sp. MAI-1 TaxID=990370 RepID=UPI0004B8B8BA|nr:response regulator transcription factor [Pseudogulbenkiania sp. MAI-1]